jgi:hypothetical protein
MHQTDNLLVTIEKQFPAKYREYYGIKRQNFFAGVTQLPEFWSCCMSLDESSRAHCSPSACNLPVVLAVRLDFYNRSSSLGGRPHRDDARHVKAASHFEM